MKKPAIIIAIVLAALIALYLAVKDEDKSMPKAGLSLTGTLSSDTEGFAQADKVIKFEFPKDHGPHNNFKTEWWYFTGNLSSDDGKRFGYQLTIFRMAMNNDTIRKSASFASNQSYMAHFTISDIDDNKFYYYEKLSRGAAGLAGAQAEPLNVWLNDWKIEERGSTNFGLPHLMLYASDGNNMIDLNLTNIKPAVLHGNNGLSYKSADSSSASYYYSYTRVRTEGRIKVKGKEHKVSGNSWMDREWSSGSLTSEQSGWDWYSLQFDDNTELMIYVLRGKKSDYSYAAYIDAKGVKKQAKPSLETTSNWDSPSGRSYPSGWNILIPEFGIDIKVKPEIKDQELRLSFRYWEGSVNLIGKKNGKQVKGKGYVELTGY